MLNSNIVVDNWFKSGAEVSEGLRLLNIYAPNTHLAALVERSPERFGYLLKQKLSRFATPGNVSIGARPRRSFREQWPFLSDQDCPAELKILAADKITAYSNYVDGHEELWNCTTKEECFLTAKKVVENFLQNRKIYDEFCNWQNHRRILGKHPIFAQSKRLSKLRSLSIVELMRKKRNLEGAIWRVKDEMKKGDRPDLLESRQRRLKEKQEQLDEVNRMIESYEREFDKKAKG